MSESPTQQPPGAGGEARRPGRGVSLRLALVAVLVPAVVAVTGVSVYLDARDEYQVALANTYRFQEEMARTFSQARPAIGDANEFQRFLRRACRGPADDRPEVIVLDPAGREVARSVRRGGVVEPVLRKDGPPREVVTSGAHEVAVVRYRDAAGFLFLIGQHFDRENDVLRAQLKLDIVSGGASVLILVVLIYLATSLLVLRPVGRLSRAAKAWAGRDFAARTAEAGPAELRALAGLFNAMARELERVESGRQAEMEQARQIQTVLLPSALPEVKGLELAAEYRTAGRVAGDLYDVFSLPGGETALVVLDVSGHGIPAAMLTGVVRMSIRRRLGEQPDPARALEQVNNDLLSYTPEGFFVTAWVGIWRLRERTITYASAGHPPAFLLRAGGGSLPEALEATGPLLAVFRGETWQAGTCRLESGDRLYVYTDGLVEAGLAGGESGPAALAQALLAGAGGDLREQVRGLVEAAAASKAARPGDDITLLAAGVR